MAEFTIQALYERHKQDVYQYLLSLTHQRPLSEDLTSEVFLGAMKALHTFKGKSDIKTWLFSIARYKWYDHLRKNKRSIDQQALAEIYLSEKDNPEAAAASNELIKRIYCFLDQEPERNRDVVLMRIEGYSFYEIAQKHGITESSARVLDFRTKQKIRGLLAKEGFTYE